ncbi:exo-alpha-sialidase [Pseudoduganella sp. SL102]|uniref:sialidase family protein n=1 Tax=Pseudoduganella sp. SL102 TaxID=2995154 RepID=UPI00248CB3F9|nr:sialidase family protein [Pseudoduganella sp. SL102]WBS03888.1 exo-alpha-sialidase [Pseudoduganella sp. SL102]
MGAGRPPVRRTGKLVALACIIALASAAAAEALRWSGGVQRAEQPAVAGTTVTAPTAITINEVSRSIIPMPAGVPSAHASALAALPRGDLLSFWWAGSRESGPDVKVYASRWSNGTWSNNWVVASRESLGKALGFGVRRIGNPVAWTAPDGTVHLYVVATGLGGWAASRIVQMHSRDDGATFTVRRVLPLSPLFNTSTLVRTSAVPLADGGWWLPVYFEIGNKYPMLMSFDAGGEPRRIGRIGSGTSSLQPAIVPVSATEVRAWMRDAGEGQRVQQALSRDGGNSWEDLAPSQLSNQSTSLAALRLSSGNFLMLYNHVAAGGSDRNVLSLALSTDARTWRPLADIVSGKPGDEFSYPTMQQVGDQLHITYTHQRQAIAHHLLRITPGKEPL